MYEQQPSYFSVKPEGEQPGDCLYVWTRPGFLTDTTPIGVIGSVVLKPHAGGAATDLRLHTNCTWIPLDEGEPITKGPIEDTTDEDPNRSGKITVRVPTTIVSHAQTYGRPPHHLAPPNGGLAGERGAKLHDLLKVMDQFTDPMPGVHVTERCITDLPPGAVLVNKVERGAGWLTKFMLPATTIPDYILLCLNWGDQGLSARLTRPDGAFDDLDHLRYVWQVGDTNSYAPVHEYWAGTRDTDPVTTGIRVGTWTITLTPPANYGERGILTHQ